MMNKMYHFTQQTIHTTEHSKFMLEAIFELDKRSHMIEIEYPYHTIVYLNGDMTQYVHYAPNEKDMSSDPVYSMDLEVIYEALNIQDDASLLLMVTLYGLLDAKQLLAVLNSKPICYDDSFLNELTSSSNGYLIYKEQLEQLYQHITNCDDAEAASFRIKWNKKIPSTRVIAISKKYNDELSMYDVLTQRSVAKDFEFYVTPKHIEKNNLVRGVNYNPSLN